ncbi:MAG: type I-U CRISPR-associated helicase/endonuclease Cas3 [Planctomycetes bacterium]|nr:type I-U CRISPR-associated helicase/endonuclease Cas3 [Planctomycetota bacterium]
MTQTPFEFSAAFEALTGRAPFPWQVKLFERFMADSIPSSCNLPTGLGKTSVIAIWLVALANRPERMPRRVVYVVNRRTVVDQTTDEVETLRARLTVPETLASSQHASIVKSLAKTLSQRSATGADAPIAISTLRGQFADNREWSADPSRPAVICGTVDMIGSRLLFEGYGIGFKSRPLHAGFLGQDALLVHDEAHLEPAFQALVEAIESEQAEGERTGELPWPKLRVMALSATARNSGNEQTDGEVFGLTSAEKNPPARIPTEPMEPIHHVWRRMTAKKSLQLHPVADEKKSADEIARLALTHRDSAAAVLVFVRTVDDVNKVCQQLTNKKSGVAAEQVLQLTGTMRGYERDRLVNDPTFKRFLPDRPADATPGTVYLVCTSAGEVGVNISADHMVCDLSTFDSMAQRLGRVNRFGKCEDTRVDVVHPVSFDEKNPLTPARERTLALLKQLNGDASPRKLGGLPVDGRLSAFAPTPDILRATEILFDGWALTTIRGKIPGRPPVAPYLHGVAEWEPSRTSVAWREEVRVIIRDEGEEDAVRPPRYLLDRYPPGDLLEDYPLKPHETLSDTSERVFLALQNVQARLKRDPAIAIWILDRYGDVEPTMLSALLSGDKKAVIRRIADCTILLPTFVGALTSQGTLGGEEAYNSTHPNGYDIADYWIDENSRARRLRNFSDEPRPTSAPDGMALVRTIDTDPLADEVAPASGDVHANIASGEDATIAPAHRRYWHWYVLPREAEDATRASTRPISWTHHTDDVVQRTSDIVEALKLPDHLREAIVIAAELHDLGKKREIWQRSIGNPKPTEWYAKPGKPLDGPPWRPRRLTEYRHEFGSLLDILNAAGEHAAKFRKLATEMQDLVLHLVAAHHGFARPHFPSQAFDHERYDGGQNEAAAYETMRRFARLQHRYGRWGLAYVESLLRAGDWAASANPTDAQGSL